jgi:hypothetical protein
VITPTLRDAPPPGLPPQVAAAWARMPWPARQRWAGKALAAREAARAARDARYRAATIPSAPGPKRTTAETTRLVHELTTEGLTPEQIITRLQVTASSIESALRKQDAPADLSRPYRTLAARARRDARYTALEPP